MQFGQVTGVQGCAAPSGATFQRRCSKVSLHTWRHACWTRISHTHDPREDFARLASQLDFDWQDSVTPTPTPSHGISQNLGEELDVVDTSQIALLTMVVVVDTFVEVSQITHEAVMEAIQQPPA